MSNEQDKRNVMVGCVVVLAIIGAFIAAAGGVPGLIVLGLFLGIGALLTYLLQNPTPKKRAWAAVLLPQTLLLLWMPKKTKKDLEQLKQREQRQKDNRLQRQWKP